ncbi:CRAL/TRIO domain-containing protein [Sporormia fimetaria CBS 119925]|uniref:Phosphatidylinositol transfer protein SFH5 n=1 Tax=Sporormia fimetaria CBS 119925 TaxID=1340428 RepID=A0A6A6VFV4_9PLEO|nr:CRAL/TRIO domain-containing protein [Sporormia fimetaria CBS 119925]
MSEKPATTGAPPPVEAPTTATTPANETENKTTTPAPASADTLEDKVTNLTITDKTTDSQPSTAQSTSSPPPAQSTSSPPPAQSTSSPPPALHPEAASTTVPPTSNTPTTPVWPETPPDHPLTNLYDSIPALVTEAQHSEIYGVELSHSSPFPTKLICQKFLRANANDLGKAKAQLLATLKWRAEFNPLAAAEETFEKERFEGLGYVLEVGNVPGSARRVLGKEGKDVKDVVTFNIYGAVKDNQKTFGDLEGFLRWRVAVMERSVHKLDLANATVPIPDYGQGPDPYQGYQVHDYLRVSFLRQDPVVRAATKKTIETLSAYYPETLSRKFFVNVPVIMGWLYQAVRLLVAAETAKKFTVLSYGNLLAVELGKDVPKEYGGDRGELKEVGEAMKLE